MKRILAITVMLIGFIGNLQAEELPAGFNKLLPTMKGWGADAVLVTAVKEKNAKGETLDDVKKRDIEWRKTDGFDAEMKQLMENNKLVREGGDIPYQFSYKKSIKKLYITEPQQQQLLLGQVAIVELQGDFELVPAKVAEKIAQRDESRVVVMNSGSENSVDEDDPYKDYQIPDDLMW